MLEISKFRFPPEKVPEILEVLDRNNIKAWLDGGWAVDALAKEQTRQHQDIDLLVSVDDRERVYEIFTELGFKNYEAETELPFRLVMYNESKSLMIDFHLVMIQEDGSAIFRITNYRENVPSYDYCYTKSGLDGKGEIAGAEVPCITLEEQIRCRTTRKYSFDDPDRKREGGINADIHDLDVIKNLQQNND